MFRVNKQKLLFIAGCVWIIAGVNILRIGILTWMHDAHYSVLKIGEAVIVFLLFLNLCFYVCSESIAIVFPKKEGRIVLSLSLMPKVGS